MEIAAGQDEFVASLLKPGGPLPANVTTSRGAPDEIRFNVYRNNVMVALIGALEQKFPVARRIVGDEFFREMARAYVQTSKPRTPLIFQYGDNFAGFVAGFEPAQSVAYLSDVVRLEMLWMRAYHAADALPLDMQALAAIAPETLASSRIEPHPSASLLCSSWPVGSIWEAHQHDPVSRLSRSSPETVIVMRPDADVHIHILPSQDHSFAAALFAGKSLGEAAQTAYASEGFDFGSALVGLASLGLIVGLLPDSESED